MNPSSTSNPRNPVRGIPLLLSLSLALFQIAPATAEIRFSLADQDPDEAMLAALHQSASADRVLPEPLSGPGNVLLLPYFEIDGTQNSKTTILGLRNVSPSVSRTVDISYYDVFGNVVAIETGLTLPPRGVATRNLRLVPGLPTDPDGFKRGFAFVAGTELVSGEYFQMDPTNAFATGNRLITNGELCFVGDARFILGGPFTGGTQFRLFVNIPLGTQPGDPPSANLTVTNEAGTVFGTVAIHTDQVVNEFTIQDLTTALPGGIGPNFGSVLFIIEAPGFGLLETTYSALGLYSVGVPASCHTPAP